RAAVTCKGKPDAVAVDSGVGSVGIQLVVVQESKAWSDVKPSAPRAECLGDRDDIAVGVADDERSGTSGATRSDVRRAVSMSLTCRRFASLSDREGARGIRLDAPAGSD